jgi:hypothetical protein
MRRQAIVLFSLVCGIIVPALSQYHVDPRNRGERIIAVVPLTGAGNPGDPKRPLFAPLPEQMRTSGIYEFTYQLSDDGKHAIVEFAAKDSAVLETILNDPRTVKAFKKGKDKKDDIEKELKKHKKDFKLGPNAIALPGVMQ